METGSVHRATTEEVSRVVGPLVLGFSSDPIVRWMFRDARVFLQAFARIVAISAQPAIEHQGALYLESEGTSVAAAIWHPPGVQPEPADMNATVREALSPAELEERAGFFAAMEAFHPKDPHWYLPMIAVDPARQGMGHGSTLLRHALERVDADRAPAYLESSNEANLPLYQRFGFEVSGEIQAGSSPKMWPMWRPGR